MAVKMERERSPSGFCSFAIFADMHSTEYTSGCSIRGTGLKCNFKVVRTLQIPASVKFCGPFQFCSAYISSQAVILAKFRLTSSFIMDKTIACVPKERSALWGLEMPNCRNGGPSSGVSMHSSVEIKWLFSLFSGTNWSNTGGDVHECRPFSGEDRNHSKQARRPVDLCI